MGRYRGIIITFVSSNFKVIQGTQMGIIRVFVEPSISFAKIDPFKLLAIKGILGVYQNSKAKVGIGKDSILNIISKRESLIIKRRWRRMDLE
jgi:hypothetical protein